MLQQPIAFVAVVSVAAKMAAGLEEELGVAKTWTRETETQSWAAIPCPVAPGESYDWDPHPQDCTAMHCAS
jgi:hypothetical protein